MSWRILDHITLYKEQGLYAAHPNIIRAPSGDLIILFHRSPYLGYPHHSHPLFEVFSCRSIDEGKTWSQALPVVSDHLGGIIDFGTHTLSDGSIFLHASTNELIPAKNITEISFSESPHSKAIGNHEDSTWISRPGIPFWVRSKDDGYSWSSPVRFPAIDNAVWGYPAEHSGVCRSGLLSLPNGRLLMPSKATDNPGGEQPYFGMIRFSDDMGETWKYGGRIAEDQIAHFSEPTIHQTPKGRILALYRFHPGPTTGAKCLALVSSEDEGETWSNWETTSISGSPGHMLGLRDGRIFITVGTRWKGQRGCTARVTEPEGTDLNSATDFIIRSDSQNSDCGYPWSVELNDGKIMVVYYYSYKDGSCGIEGTIVEEF